MDPHRELGLQRGASEADVKAAYRKLVLQCHPDRHINSSPAEAAAAAHRFKVITEAYDFLTNPNERLRSSYGASSSAGSSSSSSSSSSRAYHHYNVNTDWSHYEAGSSGYTSTISRWEWWKRAARHGACNFSHSLHVSLAVLLIGGGLMFEYSHSAVWAARNKGKSFEEVQAAVRARKQQASGAASSSGSSESGVGDSATGGAPAGQHYITSSWADNARGRFVAGRPDDPSIPSRGGGGASASVQTAAAGAEAAKQQPPRPHGVGSGGGGARVQAAAAGESTHSPPPQQRPSESR